MIRSVDYMSLMLFYMATSFHLARTPTLRLAHLKRPCPLDLNPRPRFRALAPAASFRGPQSYRFAFGQKI